MAAKKIRVNTVAPAMIYRGELGTEEVHNFLKEKFMPFNRFAKPVEIVKLVSFLSSDDASFILGAEFTIDSGASVNAVRL